MHMHTFYTTIRKQFGSNYSSVRKCLKWDSQVMRIRDQDECWLYNLPKQGPQWCQDHTDSYRRYRTVHILNVNVRNIIQLNTLNKITRQHSFYFHLFVLWIYRTKDMKIHLPDDEEKAHLRENRHWYNKYGTTYCETSDPTFHDILPLLNETRVYILSVMSFSHYPADSTSKMTDHDAKIVSLKRRHEEQVSALNQKVSKLEEQHRMLEQENKILKSYQKDSQTNENLPEVVLQTSGCM